MGLNNASSTDTYINAGGLWANDIIDKNIRDLKNKFGIDNISTEIFRLFFRQIQTNNDKIGFLPALTCLVVENNKPVTDLNGLNKRMKTTSVSTFDLSTLYTKLLHNILLMVLNV